MMKTILVVDDSSDLRALLIKFIRSIGYAGTEAKNGQDALSHFKEDSLPDLIILDSEMDTMSGPEFLAELDQRDPFGKWKVPIIMLSGKTSAPHCRVLRSMKKPFDLEKLHSAIESAFANRRSVELPRSESEKEPSSISRLAKI